ncbi:MCE family protein [Nocardioides panacisoli]|uniref:MlaD family protein n=1 Tax=Nocardioides panacisoli TaxID=627624 RepID=UPI001C62D5CC|nr:MlaD family protein [Nocardioides panacisoli]QYJ03851.1 MCE family protein [Nocardioides panacisoli]
MITRRTKVQLLVFVIITVLGVTYVGAKYAQLDRLILDRSYDVVAKFEESGGIFVGGEVTYRGVRVGQVTDMQVTDEGVDVVLRIDNEWDAIPSDARALVGNRSAIGEQYVEIQPTVDDGPFLEDGSEILVTETPIRTEKLLADISQTVSDVDQEALRTTVSELGVAFDGTGEDLQQIIDTGNSFIEAADENFDVTTELIRNANTVLNGQVDSESSLRTFADQLSLFSTALADADPDLRRLIDTGSFSVNQLRAFLEANEVPLQELLQDLVTTGQVVVRHLPAIEQALIVFPYVVEGAWSVVAKDDDNLYDAHFGLILSDSHPCTEGYESTQKRTPFQGEDLALNTDARCTAPPSTNSRGAQNLPRVAPDLDGPDPESVIGSFDVDSGEFAWGEQQSTSLPRTGSVAPPDGLGKDAWKWLYLQPLLDSQE